MRCSSFIEHECLPHTDSSHATINDLISTSGFPKTCSSSTVCTRSSRVFLVFVAKEIPIVLRG
ncbi:hypothetical protein HanIR_Chr03g0139321 [Helianthus annuus]|nr:hypothetical protein HanIR_Chr03g0139321 [Helianthus annuus]